MDVKELERFLNYQPFLNRDPKIILEYIIREAKSYLPAEQIPLIQKAYDFAAEKHA
jgi:hypothetical protein